MFRMFLAVLIAATAVGCRHEPPAIAPAHTDSRPDRSLLRAHWLGKAALSSNTNAAYLLSIWNLPEAAKFEQHVIEQLATIPLQLNTIHTNLPATNPAVALWRPCFQDLVYNETLVDIRQTAKGGLEGGIAVRLPQGRAAAWQTNLPAAFARTPGSSSSAGKQAWKLQTRWGLYHLQLSSSQGWTLLRFGPEPDPARHLSRLVEGGPTLQSTGTNAWLKVSADLAALAASVGMPLPTNVLPRADFAASSDGEYVRTAGTLSFAEPLNLALEPWTIPTNVIHNPLLSFTAVRGFRPWLPQLPLFTNSTPPALPNQFFLWSLRGGTILSYAAVPLSNAQVTVDRYGPALADANPWFTNHFQGQLLYDSTNHSITWRAVPVFAPGFQSVTSNIGEMLLGKIALMPPPAAGEAFPIGLLNILEQGTNTVYYHWEITENRLADLYANLQAARLALRKPTLPGQRAQVDFLKSVGTKLGNAVTTIKQTGPAELSYERKSHSGLSALEWHFFIDWMESPTFPFGLHTTVATDQVSRIREQMRKRGSGATNNAGPGAQ